MNNTVLSKEALKFKLDPILTEAFEKTGIVWEHGDVKMIYCMKGGPGPKLLDASCEFFDSMVE